MGDGTRQPANQRAEIMITKSIDTPVYEGPTGQSSEFVESMQFGSTQASSPGASMVMGRSDDYDRMNAASPVDESDNADSGEEKLSYVPSAAEKPKVSLTIPTVAMDTDFEDIEELSLGN
jgi:hypothetical protein